MTGPGRPTLGKSEYREPVHNDSLRSATNGLPLTSSSRRRHCRRRDRRSSRFGRCLTQGVQSTPPAGTSVNCTPLVRQQNNGQWVDH